MMKGMLERCYRMGFIALLASVIGVGSLVNVGLAGDEGRCYDQNCFEMACWEIAMASEGMSEDLEQWCNEHDGYDETMIHYFPQTENQCNSGDDCKACNVTSTCHLYLDIGDCHSDCAVFFAALSEDITKAIKAGDHKKLSELIESNANVRFKNVSSLLEVTNKCDPRATPTKMLLTKALSGRLTKELALGQD